MDLKDRVILVLMGLLASVILFGVAGLAWQRHKNANQVLDLQNQLAAKDKTLEVLPGLYEKLTLQDENLKDLVSQNKELQSQLSKEHGQLLATTETSLSWKKAYEGLANASQSAVTSAGNSASGTPSGTPNSASGAVRIRVDFKESWEYIGASGYTLTSPPEAYLKIEQLRPLKLTVSLAQLKDRSWKTYVTSSEENVQADIDVTAVNPYLEETKWYERLALRSDVGVGSTQAGAGVLLGLGATLAVGRFDVGPAAWLVVTDRADRYFGVMGAWHPFQR